MPEPITANKHQPQLVLRFNVLHKDKICTFGESLR